MNAPLEAFSLGGVPTALFSFNAIPLLGVAAAALLYLRACSILAGRGRRVPMGQRVSWFAGLGLILVATQTFVDPVGESALVSAHMAQHLLIADIPAPLLLYGLRAPVVFFFWPKPILVRAARMQWLRRFWGWLRQPQVALSVWLVTLYAWHLPVMYQAALESRPIHDLEHLTFALTAVLAWWPLMDPTHERVEGRVWKAAYVVAARMIGGILGVAMLVWPHQLYPHYGNASRAYGMSPMFDQQLAGGMMMMVDSLVIMIAATYFLVIIDRGSESDNDLLEPSVAAAIARAARDWPLPPGDSDAANG